MWTGPVDNSAPGPTGDLRIRLSRARIADLAAAPRPARGRLVRRRGGRRLVLLLQRPDGPGRRRGRSRSCWRPARPPGWRRRLVGGPRGLLVTGFDRPAVGARGRRCAPSAAPDRATGIASTTMEIDLVDDDLLVFGRIDLGADPADVAARNWPRVARRPDLTRTGVSAPGCSRRCPPARKRRTSRRSGYSRDREGDQHDHHPIATPHCQACRDVRRRVDHGGADDRTDHQPAQVALPGDPRELKVM